MNGNAFIFLNGFYHKDDSTLIHSMIKRARPRPLLVAVDGGIAGLQKIGIKPDCWISDLDSAPGLAKGFLKNIELLLYPAEKDKTDAELAIDFCTAKSISNITLFGWYDNSHETDHLLGNLFLCRKLLSGQKRRRLRFLDSRQEIIAVKNDTLIFREYIGRRLSIVPLSKKIVITLKGVEYGANKMAIRAGNTTALRNRITAKKATVTIQGLALIIIAVLP